MALEITYWTGHAEMVDAAAGKVISSESRSLSGSSAQSGTTPSNAAVVSIVATENARFEYGSNPTASASSAYIGSGERLWIDSEAGWKIAGITA